VARTFQTPHAFGSLSVVDSVRVAVEARRRAGFVRPSRARVDEARARAALADAGLADHLDRPLATLPYGVQRRVEIARALAVRPRLVLLDEPFAGLSAAESDELCELIRTLAPREVTVLLVEHNMAALMRICDRVVVLDHGRLLADGTPAKVRADERVRTAYLGIKETETRE
jgi:branched-chain amino acid transport system ATP-binding protein